jgi:hypothetical protein
MAGWQDWNYKNLDGQDDLIAGTGWQDGRIFVEIKFKRDSFSFSYSFSFFTSTVKSHFKT